jgi:hypothetical protein
MNDTISIPPGTRIKVPLARPGVLRCSRVFCQEKAAWRLYRVGNPIRTTRYACPVHAWPFPDELMARAAIMTGRVFDAGRLPLESER